MGLRVQNNIAAMNAHRQLSIADSGLSRSLQRLSSGYRINSASDDAAGLAVSSGMRADIASYSVASRNTSEASALLQVAEGAYDQISNILVRLKELTTQGTSANASQNTTDISNEVTALKNEVDRIANATEYNGESILRGYGTSTYSADTAKLSVGNGYDSVSVKGVDDNDVYTITHTSVAMTVVNTTDGGAATQTKDISDGAQTVKFESLGVDIKTNTAFVATAVAFNSATLKFSASGGDFVTGIKNDTDHYINVSIDKLSQTDLGISGVTGLTLANLDTINTAIDNLATSRGEIGAFMNRLSYASANLASALENTQAAESVIRDVDMAAEMTTFTKNQILMQAGTAMLAQANMAPQAILSLFG